MVWVNLLPWRERWLKQQRTRWLRSHSLLPLLLIAGLVGGAFADGLNHQRKQQLIIWQQATAVLQQKTDRKIYQQKILDDREKALNILILHHRLNLYWQQLIATLDQGIPDSLWLTRLESSGHKLKFNGRCSQVSDADYFLNWLKNQPQFAAVHFIQLARTSEGKLAFTVQAEWVRGAQE